jgi:hypothetical protein
MLAGVALHIPRFQGSSRGGHTAPRRTAGVHLESTAWRLWGWSFRLLARRGVRALVGLDSALMSPYPEPACHCRLHSTSPSFVPRTPSVWKASVPTPQSNSCMHVALQPADEIQSSTLLLPCAAPVLGRQCQPKHTPHSRLGRSPTTEVRRDRCGVAYSSVPWNATSLSIILKWHV